MIENDTSGQEGGASIDQQFTQRETVQVRGVREQLADKPTGSLEDYITARTESVCND